MSRLSELIKEHCPEGVEFKKLENLGSFYGGLSGKSKKDFEDGNAKFISYMNVYSNPAVNFNVDTFVKIEDTEKQNAIQYGDVIFTGSSETPDECGMSSVVTQNVEENIYVNSFCFGFRLNDVHIFNPDFLKHLFRSHDLRNQIFNTASGVTRFNVSKKRFGKIEIPIPPLPVQEEIVRILDTFTALEAELEAELEARKLQYEYYRNKLLSFDNSNKGENGKQVIWMTINELCELRNGYTPSKAVKGYWEDGTIPWFRMEDIRNNGRILYDSIQHINPIAVKGGKYFRANTFILATTATIGEHALLMVNSLANQRFTNIAIREAYAHIVDIKYFYYYMFIIDEWCKNNTNVSGFASVDMSKFKKLSIPIPPLEEQQRIVSILDRFEKLTTDLTQGIPAEIEARRQQYEYYRDKLLTFKRKETVEA